MMGRKSRKAAKQPAWKTAKVTAKNSTADNAAAATSTTKNSTADNSSDAAKSQ